MKIVRLLLLISFVLVLRAGAGTGPAIEVRPHEVDLGEIRQGSKIEQVFRIRNTGDDLLTITEIKPSCGCTAVLPAKTRLKPGEATEVTAVFDSKGFKGPIRKSLYVYSNDSKNPRLELRLTGRVVEELEVVPSVLESGGLAVGDVVAVPLQVHNRSKAPIKITAVDVLVKDATVGGVGQVIPPGGKVSLQVRFAPVTKPYPQNGYLIIRTDRPEETPLRIPVFTAVRDS